MPITHYDLEVFTPPCSPGSVRFAAHVTFDADIADLLPYLHAALDGARYNPAAPALSWDTEGHAIVFTPGQIAIGNLEDRAEAQALAEQMIALVNQTAARQSEIEPDHTAHQRPKPFEVYGLLPQTNCRECGHATCLIFGLKLIAGEAALDGCPHLTAARYAQLEGMLV